MAVLRAVVALVALGVASASIPGCSHVFKDSWTGYSFEKLKGEVIGANFGGLDYKFTLCGWEVCKDEKVVSEWVSDDGQTCVRGYGAVDDASWSPLDASNPAKGVVVKYQGGACPESSTSNPKSATFFITCDPQVDVPSIVDMDPRPDTQKCALSFSFASSVGCGYDARPSNGLSGAVVALIVIIVLLVVYCGCGMGYKRVAVGASGMESVPNIGFWRACGRYMTHCGKPPAADNSAYQGVDDDFADDDDDLPAPRTMTFGERL